MNFKTKKDLIKLPDYLQKSLFFFFFFQKKSVTYKSKDMTKKSFVQHFFSKKCNWSQKTKKYWNYLELFTRRVIQTNALFEAS